ncbi:hypothetical protein L3Q82_021912 [Scortum barcoo]|uniref:Uncharacterized protein n=1 Tax=Scortum barcoo TaxID=214431 RepID=A0ACB8X655_9TELE|nr:hypothetical protein L3Q82_021912 [Scortum barcoo]
MFLLFSSVPEIKSDLTHTSTPGFACTPVSDLPLKPPPPLQYKDHTTAPLTCSPLPSSRIYNFSHPENEAMEKYIRESLAAGIIHQSKSPLGAGFFFFVGKIYDILLFSRFVKEHQTHIRQVMQRYWRIASTSRGKNVNSTPPI